MARTRLFNSAVKPTKGRAPTTREGWRNLLDQAITKATEQGDRRLAGLLKARQDGIEEKVLRTLGIISDACLNREFPEQTPRT